MKCPNCESTDISTTLEKDNMKYCQGRGSLEVTVPVRHCGACGLAYEDEEAEDIRMKADAEFRKTWR